MNYSCGSIAVQHITRSIPKGVKILRISRRNIGNEHMLSAEHKHLIESYIASRTWVQDADMVLRRKDDSDWAESALYDTVWEQPAVGWELIREICRSANSTEILEELANGPLHQLLVEHPEVLSDIEIDARSEASVRALLSSLWEEQPLPQEIKARVLRASKPEH